VTSGRRKWLDNPAPDLLADQERAHGRAKLAEMKRMLADSAARQAARPKPTDDDAAAAASSLLDAPGRVREE
jgi:hypothetical protein